MDYKKAFEEYKKINFENRDIIKKLREENRELRMGANTQQTVIQALSQYIDNLEKNK